MINDGQICTLLACQQGKSSATPTNRPRNIYVHSKNIIKTVGLVGAMTFAGCSNDMTSEEDPYPRYEPKSSSSRNIQSSSSNITQSSSSEQIQSSSSNNEQSSSSKAQLGENDVCLDYIPEQECTKFIDYNLRYDFNPETHISCYTLEHMYKVSTLEHLEASKCVIANRFKSFTGQPASSQETCPDPVGSTKPTLYDIAESLSESHKLACANEAILEGLMGNEIIAKCQRKNLLPAVEKQWEECEAGIKTI